MKDEDPFYKKNLDEAKKIASERLGFELNDIQCISYALSRFIRYEEWQSKRKEKTVFLAESKKKLF